MGSNEIYQRPVACRECPSHRLFSVRRSVTRGFAPSPTQPLVEAACEDQACIADAELRRARAYLVETARPGGTMMRQGSDLAIERLHPEFAKRLAGAIQAARRAGLADAGIFSAYRPPVFGVGGFADKYLLTSCLWASCGHAWHWSSRQSRGSAMARDRSGIRHRLSIRLSGIAWSGIHCQPTHLDSVRAENPLRDTIERSGPIDLNRMFEVGNRFLADVQSTIASVVVQRRLTPVNAASAPAAPPRHAQKSQARLSSRTRASRLTSRQGRSPSKAVSSSRTKIALLTKRTK